MWMAVAARMLCQHCGFEQQGPSSFFAALPPACVACGHPILDLHERDNYHDNNREGNLGSIVIDDDDPDPSPTIDDPDLDGLVRDDSPSWASAPPLSAGPSSRLPTALKSSWPFVQFAPADGAAQVGDRVVATQWPYMCVRVEEGPSVT